MSKQKAWIGLQEEFNKAKESRNVLVKVIISESQLSDSHFYKVISGERKPGDENIENLAKSLEITEEHIRKLLDKEDRISTEYQVNKNKNQLKKRNKFILASTLIVLLASGFLTYKYFNFNQEEISVLPFSDKPKIVGDNTAFIKDITIIDGTQFLTNTKHKKVWRIKNTGSVTWKNRFLMRITKFSDHLCHTEKMIPIKNTKPGEEVDIETYFTTIQFPGSCVIDWRMADEFGKIYFPNKRSMYFSIHVTNDKNLIKE